MTSSSGSLKQIVLSGLSLVGTLAVFALFLLCCWSAAADAQGAVAFFFALPMLGVGLMVSLLLAWIARRSRGGRVALSAAAGLAIFIALFYGASFVPRLRFFSDGVIRLVADGYKGVTGKSPFEADKGL